MSGVAKRIDHVRNNPLIQEEALRFFTQGRLEEFDALVGEQACQLRAMIITTMYEDHVQQIKDGTFTLDILSQDVCTFLLLVYFLTKFKQPLPVGQKQSLDIQAIQMFLGLSLKGTNNVIGAARTWVADYSVKHLNFLLETKLSHLKELAPLARQTYSLHYRRMVGCYLSLVFLYYEAFASNRPIVIKIIGKLNEEKIPVTIVYTPSIQHPYGYQLMPAQAFSDYQDRSVIVLEGDSGCGGDELIQKIAAHPLGLLRVIRANGAQHAQFPGLNTVSYDFSKTPVFGQGYWEALEIAHKEGYSLENPSTFLIRHIYGNLLRHEVTAD
jgi:hypothetical protein